MKPLTNFEMIQEYKVKAFEAKARYVLAAMDYLHGTNHAQTKNDPARRDTIPTGFGL